MEKETLKNIADKIVAKEVERAMRYREGYEITCIYRNGWVKYSNSEPFRYHWHSNDFAAFRELCEILIAKFSEIDGLQIKTFRDEENGIDVPFFIKEKNKANSKFIELQQLLKEKANFRLDRTSLYKVSIFGKRGIYSECGERCYYACQSETYCESAIRRLQKINGNFRVEIKQDDDIHNLQASIANESETYGTRETYLLAIGEDGKVYFI